MNDFSVSSRVSAGSPSHSSVSTTPGAITFTLTGANSTASARPNPYTAELMAVSAGAPAPGFRDATPENSTIDPPGIMRAALIAAYCPQNLLAIDACASVIGSF